MAGGMSKMAKRELLATIRDRYRMSSRKDKSRILDEFIAVTGHHRKHGIRLLAQSGGGCEQADAIRGRRRIYDEAVREAVILTWEASDRICGKRLNGGVASLGGVHGTTRPFGPGRDGEGAVAVSQPSDLGPVAETHSRHGGQPAQAPTQPATWSPHSSSYLR